MMSRDDESASFESGTDRETEMPSLLLTRALNKLSVLLVIVFCIPLFNAFETITEALTTY